MRSSPSRAALSWLLLLTACFPESGHQILAEETSPDGAFVATFSRVSPHATANFVSWITLHKAGASFSPGEENCIYKDIGHIPAELAWHGDRTLVLSLSQGDYHLPLRREREVLGVTLLVTFTGPRNIYYRLNSEHIGPVVVLYGVEGGVRLPESHSVRWDVAPPGPLLIEDPLPALVGEIGFSALSARTGLHYTLYTEEAEIVSSYPQIVSFETGRRAGIDYHAFFVGIPDDVDEPDTILQAALSEALSSVTTTGRK